MCSFNQINSHFIDYIGIDFKSIFVLIFGNLTLSTPFFKIANWFQTNFLYMEYKNKNWYESILR